MTTDPTLNKLKRLNAIIALSFLAGITAFGQTTPTTEPPVNGDAASQASKPKVEQDKALELPAFSVTTARRKEENSQQVPISLTSISQQTLDANNLVTLPDFAQLVTSLTVNSANTGIREQSSVTIRGQGIANIGGVPSTGLYLNEVPIQANYDGSLVGAPGIYFDLETIDVLKGPQGTLFGLNTIGGAMLVRTARPTNDFGGNIQVTYGNYNDREVSGAFNIPLITDKLLFRFAFDKQVRKGYSWVLSSPNHPQGFDADNRDWESARFSLTFRPNDKFQNDLIVTDAHYKSNGSAAFLTELAQPAIGFFPAMVQSFAQQQALGARIHVPVDTDTDATEGEFIGVENLTTLKISDNFAIKNIFGLHEGYNTEAADVDGTDSGLFSLLPRKDKTHQTTEEVQLLGKSFDENLDWVAGAFFLDAAPPNNYYSYQAIRVLYPTVLPLQVAYRRETSKSSGYFIHGVYDLAKARKGLKLNAGVRYSKDDRRSFSSPTLQGTATPTANPPQLSTAWTGTLGLDYQLASDKLLYVAARRGYRAGGVNQLQDATNNFYTIPYSPEYLNDLELGIKMDWKAGAVPIRTNIAIYTDDYQNMQVTQQVPNPRPNGVPYVDITTNAAKARVQGAEFEMVARVSHAIELNANYTYLSFKYKSFGAGVDSAALLASAGANRVPHQYSVGGSYYLPIAAQKGSLVLRLNYHWTDACGDYLGTSQIPAYGVANMSLNWNHVLSKPIDVSLFCSNLADKVYYDGGIGFLGFWEKTYGPPRMYGMRVRYGF